MNLKEIKEIAYNDSSINNLTAIETVFALSLSKLYADYKNGLIGKEKANRYMQRVSSAFNFIDIEIDRYKKMQNLIGKEVEFCYDNFNNFKTTGTVEGIIFKGKGKTFLSVNANNTVYQIDLKDVKE